MQTRIRQEGFRNSKVMDYAQQLTDVIGPRLTGSPAMKRANDWTRSTFQELGLQNAHLEPFKFGKGWTSEGCTLRMLAPGVESLYALPKAWSPATNGPVRGKVVRAKLESAEDLAKYKGKLAGAIVLLAEPKELKPQEKAALERYDDKELTELGTYKVPAATDTARFQEYMKRRAFRKALAQFAQDEHVAALVDLGAGDGGVFRVQASGTWKDDEPLGVPSVGLAPEHYGRLARLLDKGVDVQLELDLKATFHTQDLSAYNTLAELPGTDKKGEVVMLGAHMDSWHTGTGATDNAAGVAVMMEAMRILKAVGVAPKRTVRVALWSGEEQGLLGSRAWVSQHLASRPEPKDPAEAMLPASMRKEKLPLTLKPEQAKVSAYFNLDNGTGKVRGIYAQENAAVMPLFRGWLDAVQDLGATTVTARNTGSTDHTSFDDVGVPGFQFIQDEVEYSARTHHTNWDTFERLQREDLMQASVVVATFVWEAANRPELLPRKPLKPEDLAQPGKKPTVKVAPVARAAP
ncbi:M20/M25/M40 family metallo-hydrolase [Aggregicoccus sp. 17bor-14]|nr:M20/M25/M40 family metallo-hydrolase [Simulacricoccus sp. 17bor-14]MRI87619.1 M20/M25/M40 family metallo-hydrolase [Aggregicoccus sp. 17bor-14]